MSKLLTYCSGSQKSFMCLFKGFSISFLVARWTLPFLLWTVCSPFLVCTGYRKTEEIKFVRTVCKIKVNFLWINAWGPPVSMMRALPLTFCMPGIWQLSLALHYPAGQLGGGGCCYTTEYHFNDNKTQTSSSSATVRLYSNALLLWGTVRTG